MSKRKYISWKTRCAAAVYELDFLRMVHFGPGTDNNNTNIPLDHAKEMTEDQYLSLWQWDHNVLYANAVALGRNPDHFSNIRPMPIKEHREKTRQDLKILAKGKRIRAKHSDSAGADNPVAQLRYAPLRIGPDERGGVNYRRPSIRRSSGPHTYSEGLAPSKVIEMLKGIEKERRKRILRSRGFDKTKTRGFDGKVRPRNG